MKEIIYSTYTLATWFLLMALSELFFGGALSRFGWRESAYPQGDAIMYSLLALFFLILGLGLQWRFGEKSK